MLLTYRTSRVHLSFTQLLALAGVASITLGSFAFSGEPSVSEPLDQPVIIHERLVSNESEDVPPPPVPPSEYHTLDSLTPALIAEEILRLRDTLGEAPLSGRAAFQLLPLGNRAAEDQPQDFDFGFEESEHSHDSPAVPAPRQLDEDRRMLRDRLRGMASRPMFTWPHVAVREEMEDPCEVPLHLHPGVPKTAPPQAYYAPTYVPYNAYPAPPTTCYPTTAPYVKPEELPEHRRINVLRDSARQLEETAHHLECHEQFERADLIRELAQKLRLDARELKAKEEATALRAVRPVLGVQTPKACEAKDCPPEIPENAEIPRY